MRRMLGKFFSFELRKSGLEFTKENKDKISTPIILLTAKGEASERIEGLDIGTATMSKPL